MFLSPISPPASPCRSSFWSRSRPSIDHPQQHSLTGAELHSTERPLPPVSTSSFWDHLQHPPIGRVRQHLLTGAELHSTGRRLPPGLTPSSWNHLRPPIDHLQQCSLTGAELHSSERSPPPRCHPATRMELRGEVQAWLVNENREQDVLWLFGPAGVGKSAIAQTVGELAEELGIFGAAIFFSRSRKVDDSSLFTTSIAFQLTHRSASYRTLVTDAIQEGSGILRTVDKRTQFTKLLTEPFYTLKLQKKSLSKFLIVIDGLDECGGETEQLNLVRLIMDTVEDFDSPPFLWLICSRPEHHLKEFFLDGGLSNFCLGRDLLPHEPGADADVQKYLINELKRVMEKYSQYSADILIEDPEKSSKLVRIVSGVFIVASSILAFVGDPVVANPASQLQIVLSSIDNLATDDGSQNFLAPIDALYQGVLQALEKEHLPQTLQILGSCAISPPIPALHLANLLGITQDAFYSALRTLHAFLSVPHHTIAAQESLHFFHASFPDFLAHPKRSGEFFQDSDIHRFRLIEACFHALDSNSTAHSSDLSWLPPEPRWDDEDNTIPEESPLSISHGILTLAATHIWDLCTRVSKPQEREVLLKIVANFDFRRLQLFSDELPVQPFIGFIRWIYMLGKEVPNLMHMVRTHCNFNVDMVLQEKCSGISEPLTLDSGWEIDELEQSPRYVFAGFDEKTVVILLVPEAVMIYSMDDFDDI